MYINFGTILLIGVGAIAGYLWHKRQVNKRKEEERRFRRDRQINYVDPEDRDKY